MILKIQNFSREGSFFHRNFEFLISFKIVSQYGGNSEFDYTGWMGSIDLHISGQNPSIETTTSG